VSEYNVHAACVQYLEMQYPEALFYSDLNGIKLPIGLAVKVKRIQHKKHKWLDLFLPEPRRDYNGLFVEIKETPEKLYTKNGEMRKSEHINAQVDTAAELERRGYLAVFAGGFDEFKRIVDWYFDGN